MRSLQTIGQLAADYVDSPTDPDVIGYAISGVLECIDFLNMRTWSFTLVTSGFDLVAGQTDYVFPGGIRAPRHCALVGTNGRTVGYLDPKSFAIEVPDTGVGDPAFYTVLLGSDTLRFNNAPNADSISTVPSGQFTYYARIEYPAVATSGVNVPVEVERLLVEYARAHTAERFDNEKAAAPRQRFEQGFRVLRSQESINEETDWEEQGW